MILNTLIMILIYPAIFFCVVQPALYKWKRVHTAEPLPPALIARAEVTGRLWIFVRFALTALLLFVWVTFRAIPTPGFVRELNWRLLAGIVEITVALVTGRLLFQTFFPRVKQNFANHPLNRSSLRFWILVFLTAALVEEAWRALCLTSMSHRGTLLELASLALLSAASTIAQASGVPARISGIQEEAAWQLVLGIALGAAFVAYGTFLVPAIVSFSFNTFNVWQVRHAYSREIAQRT